MLALTAVLIIGFIPQENQKVGESKILSFEVNPQLKDIKFYWKDDNGEHYGNAASLNNSLKRQNKKLVFAVNGGMYQKDQSPQGLFIEKGIQKSKINAVQNAYGNFYMQPNGIFYLTKNGNAFVTATKAYSHDENINYATQSGPMLVINGTMHPKFNKGSENVHIRNGVGILPNGNVLFAMSKERINFYDFANYFIQKGCKNALYLDGFVSRTYLPSKNWIETDGQFGVIIGVTEKD